MSEEENELLQQIKNKINALEDYCMRSKKLLFRYEEMIASLQEENRRLKEELRSYDQRRN